MRSDALLEQAGFSWGVLYLLVGASASFRRAEDRSEHSLTLGFARGTPAHLCRRREHFPLNDIPQKLTVASGTVRFQPRRGRPDVLFGRVRFSLFASHLIRMTDAPDLDL